MVNVVYTGSDAFVTCTPNHVLVVSPPSWNTNVVVFLSSRCVSSLTKLSQWIVKNNKKLKSRMLNLQLRILAEIVHHIFGPWITWNSGIAAAPFNPNRRFLFTVYVAFEPLSPRNKSTVLYIKSLAQNTELSRWNYFTSGPKIFHLHQEPNKYNTLIKNHPRCATHFNLVQLCHIYINREALSIALARISWP